MDVDASDVNVSAIAAAIAEPARTRMLLCLLDGRARTSTELAAIADVSASTASVHLGKLKQQEDKIHAQMTAGAGDASKFDQLAGLNANEAAHLDERMGPFQGRLARDRVIEQADLLARGDTETFEETFGKLGG